MPLRATPLLLAILAPCLCAAVAARAESGLVLPFPASYENIPADTYDQDSGERLGDAYIRLNRAADGRVRMEGKSAIEAGDHTLVEAEMVPHRDGSGLQLVRQQSRSFDAAGNPMGVLSIDHMSGLGHCTAPFRDGKPGETKSIELPRHDRVANIPLNLLFQPLVSGERNEVKFQIMLCRGGPRIVTAMARVVDRQHETALAESELVHIRYELSLPKLLARMVERWLPHLSFWFDPNDHGAWIGHQMPLYSKGPTVLVVRNGRTPAGLRVAP